MRNKLLRERIVLLEKEVGVKFCHNCIKIDSLYHCRKELKRKENGPLCWMVLISYCTKFPEFCEDYNK